MQAQAIRTDQAQAALTSQQSLQSIQTLLKAGLGCITYLRNLLPCENFSESYLTSSGSGSLSSQPSSSAGSLSAEDAKRNVSGFKIMTVTRGFTEEADKLLDYLEHGIFDALQKQYLRSFIFAIYLDSQDPNNIVEAYTFNFYYHQLPGTDIVVPVMSLDADLERLSLSGGIKKPADPVSDASKQGRVPTLGEVKRSLKALIKNLIQATTQMDTLPKRRFATFKLFYYGHTPDDYEPTHFRPGDAKKDKWFFSTHDKGEVPEKCSVGSLHTGYHGVDVRVTSVSGFLPSAEDNNAPFLGTTSGGTFMPPAFTPTEEAILRLQQVQIQRDDALERHVIWDADEGLCDADADGEDDPEYVADCDQPGKCSSLGTGMDFVAPIGIRSEDGQIIPFSQEERHQIIPADGHLGEAQFAGKHDSVPNGIAQLAQTKRHPAERIQQTQPLDHTQVIDSPALHPDPLSSPSRSPSPTPQAKYRNLRSRQIHSPEASLPPSDIVPDSASSLDPEMQTIDTQMVQELIVSACVESEDTEMLDLDTQVVPGADDSIHSFQSSECTRSQVLPGSDADAALTDEHDKAESLETFECECGVVTEDCDCCMCDGGCRRWFHTWCMGYHSAKDTRMPSQFICFDCRVKADQNWDLIMVHDLYPRMMARFRDVAIFRRAIKMCELRNPESLSAFTKLIGCDPVVAGQLFKRLEAEEFIAVETNELDNIGLMKTTTTRPPKGKNKGKITAKTRQSRRLMTAQKSKYVFVKTCIGGQTYKDYFDPDPEVEKRLLGLSDLKPRRKSHKKKTVEDVDVEMKQPDGQPSQPGDESSLVHMGAERCVDVPSHQGDSQTQDETQLAPPLTHPDHVYIQSSGDILKRKTSKISEQTANARKKIKMSIGPAVDLGD